MNDNDGKPGLRIETAASVVARNIISDHLNKFGWVITRERVAGQAVVAAYIDGLAGSVALTIAGGHGSKTEVVEATIAKLREAIERDLRHMRVK